jgi:hypothetical protein
MIIHNKNKQPMINKGINAACRPGLAWFVQQARFVLFKTKHSLNES